MKEKKEVFEEYLRNLYKEDRLEKLLEEANERIDRYNKTIDKMEMEGLPENMLNPILEELKSIRAESLSLRVELLKVKGQILAFDLAQEFGD